MGLLKSKNKPLKVLIECPILKIYSAKIILSFGLSKFIQNKVNGYRDIVAYLLCNPLSKFHFS